MSRLLPRRRKQNQAPDVFEPGLRSRPRVADSDHGMAHDDSELEQLSYRLMRCLGRIDEEAFRLQTHDGEHFDFGEVERITYATDELVEAVDSLLVVAPVEAPTDVNAIVTGVTAECLDNLNVPVVQRHTLCDHGSEVSAPASMVRVAVRRAMSLAASSLVAGSELSVSTRNTQGAVLVEISALGCRLDDGLEDRVETLRAFLSDFGGGCTVFCEQDDLYLVLELPQVMVTDQGDPA